MDKNKNNWKLCSDDTQGEVWLMNYCTCSLSIFKKPLGLFSLFTGRARAISRSSWQGQLQPLAQMPVALESIYSWSLLPQCLCESIILWAQFSSTLIATADATLALGKGRLCYWTSSLQLWALFFPLISLSKTEVRKYISLFYNSQDFEHFKDCLRIR